MLSIKQRLLDSIRPSLAFTTCVLVSLISPYNLAGTIPEWGYSIIRTEKHNPSSFTQGWVINNGIHYESSGHYGRSFIQRDDQKSTLTANLPRRYFAEGLTLFNDALYLLTWKENTLLIIDTVSLAVTGRLSYTGEGWGLTHNNKAFIMSNGTSTVYFRDTNDFSIQQTIRVKQPLRLNELEYIDEIIWANNWNDDNIYAINSHNGCLLGKIDLSLLRQHTVNPNPSNILNGIAYDENSDGLWVTGKYWPKRYLITRPAINATEAAC
ncbi:MAG: glutamine cyclotransferase [Kiritimatiellia bacterium]|jgi:glutamine cyclotransferase